LDKFKPADVRRILEKMDGPLLYATSDWYGDLSESYIHITPQTKPNDHGQGPVVGGVFQKDGATTVLHEMTMVLCNLAFLICKYFDFPDSSLRLREIL
jgi:hypothetical protein